MFKFLIPILLAFSFPLEALSGQFGLEMGDTKKDIEKKGVKLIDVGDYYFMTYKVPKSNSNLKDYALMITPNNGLCQIMTATENFPTNSFGSSIKDKFNFFENLLSKKYGEKRKSDYLASGSLWTDRNYWTMGLLQKERVLSAEWNSSYGSKLPQNNVNNILLRAGATDVSTGLIAIQYRFSNYSACNEEYENAQSDSL
tara:strand:+ start:223 stop:819 length:597 start_codon:yes stop_codon:yes gene_type:complete